MPSSSLPPSRRLAFSPSATLDSIVKSVRACLFDCLPARETTTPSNAEVIASHEPAPIPQTSPISMSTASTSSSKSSSKDTPTTNLTPKSSTCPPSPSLHATSSPSTQTKLDSQSDSYEGAANTRTNQKKRSRAGRKAQEEKLRRAQRSTTSAALGESGSDKIDDNDDHNDSEMLGDGLDRFTSATDNRDIQSRIHLFAAELKDVRAEGRSCSRRVI